MTNRWAGHWGRLGPAKSNAALMKSFPANLAGEPSGSRSPAFRGPANAPTLARKGCTLVIQVSPREFHNKYVKDTQEGIRIE